MEKLTIGQIAKEVNISRDAIRIYERQGLITAPLRASNGYRVYSTDVIAQLRFIQRAKNMGFTLKEIGELLAIKHTKHNTCEEVRTEAQDKFKHVEAKIVELQRLKKALQILVKTCDNNKSNHEGCPLLDALEDNSEKRGIS